MPSLKDLRNRIASVKATQKITKAMQMVAAAKLRRAQSAAEAARPYAQHMGQVLGNLASGLVPGPETPRLFAGTGAGPHSSPRRLHRRARPVRRLQLVDRAPCPRPRQPASGGGQGRQDHLRRQEGLRHPAAAVRQPHHRLRRPARRAPARLRARRHGGAEDPRALRERRVRRRDPVLLALQVDHRPDPDGAADHPGRDRHRR